MNLAHLSNRLLLARSFLKIATNEVKKEYDREWKALARKWSRPAAYRSQ
jgi:hypothetical protein